MVFLSTDSSAQLKPLCHVSSYTGSVLMLGIFTGDMIDGFVFLFAFSTFRGDV